MQGKIPYGYIMFCEMNNKRKEKKPQTYKPNFTAGGNRHRQKDLGRGEPNIFICFLGICRTYRISALV